MPSIFSLEILETVKKMRYDKKKIFTFWKDELDMEMKIGVIKGDGIGPEIVDEAMKVLDQTAKVYGHSISYTQLLMGGASIDEAGVPLTEATLAAAKASDAVLMGSFGGDAKTSPWYQLEPSKNSKL